MEINYIAKAFVKAQKAFEAATKDKSNPHFRSKYADLGNCIDAVRDALNENGIALMQITHESDGGVTVETTLLHESGQSLSGGRLFVPATKHDAQGFGSALTYARRYSLLAACGIAPEDDDGNAATSSAPQRQKATPKPSLNMEDAQIALDAADSMDALKSLFSTFWKIATEDQKPQIQATYERRKAAMQEAA